MKKLILALMAVCFSLALATPVAADVAPAAVLIFPITLLVILIAVPLAAWLLYRLLRKRKK